MAKNRNKKNKNGAVSMDISQPANPDLPQAMDTSESVAQTTASGISTRKVKGRPMKRSKNVRKMKAIVKAISKTEKAVQKMAKHENKTSRIQSAKQLYE